MQNPKQITLTYAATAPEPQGTAQPMVVIGGVNDAIAPADFVTVDASPADADAVAAGLMAAS